MGNLYQLLVLLFGDENASDLFFYFNVHMIYYYYSVIFLKIHSLTFLLCPRCRFKGEVTDKGEWTDRIKKVFLSVSHLNPYNNYLPSFLQFWKVLKQLFCVDDCSFHMALIKTNLHLAFSNLLMLIHMYLQSLKDDVYHPLHAFQLKPFPLDMSSIFYLKNHCLHDSDYMHLLNQYLCTHVSVYMYKHMFSCVPYVRKSEGNTSSFTLCFIWDKVSPQTQDSHFLRLLIRKPEESSFFPCLLELGF